MSELFGREGNRKRIFKLHQGEDPEKIEGAISFETGSLSKEEIETIFNTLPVDITFVDREDRVRYFSQTKDRICKFRLKNVHF